MLVGPGTKALIRLCQKAVAEGAVQINKHPAQRRRQWFDSNYLFAHFAGYNFAISAWDKLPWNSDSGNRSNTKHSPFEVRGLWNMMRLHRAAPPTGDVVCCSGEKIVTWRRAVVRFELTQ